MERFKKVVVVPKEIPLCYPVEVVTPLNKHSKNSAPFKKDGIQRY